MPKDFAGRDRPKPRKRNPPRRQRKTSRVLFHGPSFSFGALVGAAIIILAAYAPELFDTPADLAGNDPQAGVQVQPVIEFDFPDLLKQSEVIADPTPYAVPEQSKPDIDQSYHIQAASFRAREDADKLRARLLLQDLPARTSTSTVSGQTWHRVTVGPFQRRVEADRAMTRLREQRLSAIWLNPGN